jgi:hypothetical protein
MIPNFSVIGDTSIKKIKFVYENVLKSYFKEYQITPCAFEDLDPHSDFRLTLSNLIRSTQRANPGIPQDLVVPPDKKTKDRNTKRRKM